MRNAVAHTYFEPPDNGSTRLVAIVTNTRHHCVYASHATWRDCFPNKKTQCDA